MRRIIGYLLLASLVVSASVWLASRPGVVNVEWLGWRVQTSVPLLLLLLALALGILFLLYRVLAGIFALPGGIGRAFSRRRQRKGLDAMAQSLSALFEGEFDKAHKRASDAERALAGTAAGRILVARAALAGELEAGDAPGRAQSLHETLLDDPATEMVGLRGLVELAEADGHIADVGTYAARALALSPKAEWAVRAMVAAQVKSSAWAGVVQTLDSARKNAVIGQGESGRLIAVAYLAEADTATPADAVAITKKATDADPTSFPAVVAYAKALFAESGTPKRAQKVIEDAWRRRPHPDLAAAYLALFPGDDALQLVNHASHLVESNPDHLESRLLVSQTSAAASLWGQARTRLKDVSSGETHDPRAALILADVEEREQGQVARALPWLRKALEWGPKPAWRCSACAAPSAQWRPKCPTCGGFATLVWPSEPQASTDKAVALVKKPFWSRVLSR